MRTRNSSTGPLNSVTAPHEGPKSIGGRRPVDGKLDGRRVGRRHNIRVEDGTTGDKLFKLAVVDLELCGIDGIAEDRNTDGVNCLRPEVLVEVGVLLRYRKSVSNFCCWKQMKTVPRTTARMKEFPAIKVGVVPGAAAVDVAPPPGAEADDADDAGEDAELGGAVPWRHCE